MESFVSNSKLASGRQQHKALQRLTDFFSNASDAEKDNVSGKMVSVMLSTEAAIKQLVVLLASEDDHINHRATVLLANFCKVSSEFRTEVASCHLDAVITAIMEGAEPCGSQSRAKALVQEESLLALGNIATNAKAAEGAAAAGAIDLLVRTMKLPGSSKQDEKIKSYAAVALFHVLQASTNRSRQATAAGAIEAAARLAFSQNASIQLNASLCLIPLLDTPTQAQLSTHAEHIKLAIAALAPLIARNSATGTAEALAQEAALRVLGSLQVVLMTGNSDTNRNEYGWGDLQVELFTSLAHVRAGPQLLKIGSQHSMLVLAGMFTAVPGQSFVLARSEGSIDRLKQLLQSPDPTTRILAARMIESIRSEPELARLVGDEVDTASALEEGRELIARFDTASPIVRCCAKCGAVDGEGGVQLSDCSACRRVAYCSRACQKEHWKEHKPSCMSRN